MATANYEFSYDNREIRLVDHLPPILRPVYDYRGMCNASGIELERLYSNVTRIIDDQFIGTASPEAIAKWEKYLNITPNGTDTLDERKFRVLAQLNDSPPYTDVYLIRKLNELCGTDCWRMFKDYDQYRLTIQLAAETPTNTETVANLIRRIVPANLEVVVQNYRLRHSELVGFTHAELSAYSHDEIKYGELTEQTNI